MVLSLFDRKIQHELWTIKPVLRWYVLCAIQNRKNCHFPCKCSSGNTVMETKTFVRLEKFAWQNPPLHISLLSKLVKMSFHLHDFPFFWYWTVVTDKLTFSVIFLQKIALTGNTVVVISQAKMRNDWWIRWLEAYEGYL